MDPQPNRETKQLITHRTRTGGENGSFDDELIRPDVRYKTNATVSLTEMHSLHIHPNEVITKIKSQ